MSPFHVLLRVLLCISMIFYGSGVTAAATGMQMGYATVAATTVHSTGATSSGDIAATCHDAAGLGLPAARQSTANIDGGTSDALASNQAATDCCVVTSCDCSCAQQVQVATSALGVGDLMPARSTAVRSMTTGHASPALPHLIRPPIG